MGFDRGARLLELGRERRNRALAVVQFRALLGDPLVALGQLPAQLREPFVALYQ